MKKDSIEARQGCLLILSPFILVLVGMLSFVGLTNKRNIVVHSEEYKPGYIIIDSLSSNSSGGATGTHYGVGFIEGTLVRGEIAIGTGYDTNFNRERYPVFYRPDGKFTLRREKNETRFNVTLHIFKFLGFTVVPILGLIILSYYYYTLRKRVKQIDKKEQD